MALIIMLSLLVSTASTAAATDQDAFIGLNIGPKVPSPDKAVALLSAYKIQHVRLYDADRAMLMALANTGITVAVSVPNDSLSNITRSNSAASDWVSENVVAHYPATNITTICIGSEILTSIPDKAPLLISALTSIHSALVSFNLDKKIRVSSPVSSSVVLGAFPSPSQAFFNRSWSPVLIPMLEFLRSTNSYFMINIYPYMYYAQNTTAFPLDYALFRPLPSTKQVTDAKTHLRYSNAFDTMVDAAYFAMAGVNITGIPVMVTESGWPWKGDPREPDATQANAEMYNKNLVRHVLSKTGTPKNPGVAVNTYIYELYDEGASHYGLFDRNGVAVYTLDTTTSGVSVSGNQTSNNQSHCVAKAEANAKKVQAALDWACGSGKVDCAPLLEGRECFEPDNVYAHGTYAFDAYYHQMGKAAGSCDFDGVATVITTAPGNGTCTFPQSSGGGGGRNMSLVNATVPEADSGNEFSGASATLMTYLVGSPFPIEYYIAAIIVLGWTAFVL